MSHKIHLYVFVILLTVMGLVFNLGIGTVPASALNLGNTPTPTAPPSTPTPVARPGLDPTAWLDGAIDMEQFGPLQPLVVHFNTPMAQESSDQAVLSWPNIQGASTWSNLGTTLTFTPSTALDSSKTYTFFLDPDLRAKDGKTLKNPAEWTLRIQSGPSILNVLPQAGSLNQHHNVIKVYFDRTMKTTISKDMLSIEPPLPFELKWESDRILQIIPKGFFESGLRYDLTLRGGRAENALFAADNTYLSEDYRWFYWQQPLETDFETIGSRVLSLKFNYELDPKKSGDPFSITPQLDGEWQWISSHELRFTAKEVIPASKEFTIRLLHPLIHASGLEITAVADIAFSGHQPVRLANPNIVKSDYSDNLVADLDVRDICFEFSVPVDHASAEKAFSISPALPGSFRWEKSIDGSKETLIYTLSELFKRSTTYHLKLDSTLQDVRGDPVMVYPYEQNVMTASWGGYYGLSFGEEGANVQVVDVNGARRIQFGGGDDQTYFAAYRFDLIDFAKLYAEHYQYRSGATNVRDIPIPSDLQPAAIWRNIVTRGTGEQSITETILPNDLAAGLYVINLQQDKLLYDQIFVVLTSNVLVVKNDGDELLAWLTDINGESIPDAEVRLYTSRGEKVREGKTDENGLYRVSIPSGAEPMLVSARVLKSGLSGDVTLAGVDGWGSRFPYDYNPSSYSLPEGQPYLIYIYTERPIYRPGQDVNFKTLIRKDDDVRYSVPDEGTPVQVRVLDARGNTIESMQLQTSRFGTINSKFNISEGAMLGEYQLDVEVNGVTTSQIFKVEDYRKPDYQIELTSLQPEKQNKFVRGEEMKVKVTASYYFGEPLANTKLQVNFYHVWPLDVRVKGSLVTDANGEAVLTFSAPYNQDHDYYSSWSNGTYFQSMRMEVVADDGSNQAVAGSYGFSVYRSSEQFKLETDGYFAQPGETYSVTATVMDLFNQPVAGRDLTLTTTSWNQKTYEYNTAEQNFQLQTDAKGIVKQDIKLGAGYHQLTLSGLDAHGYEVQVQRWVYVFRNMEDWFDRRSDRFLSISAEKDSYKPYETARFAIESTFSGPALLTFERGSVINTRMIELTAPLTIVESDVIPEHAPNVYVTVNAWQARSKDVGRERSSYSYLTYADSYLRLAKTQIHVDSSTKALDIDITTDKQIYAPGETLTANIQVNDSNGKPVQAELSLAVVDEAIYGLSEDLSEDIFDAFYGQRAHSVMTFDSMAPARILMVGGRGGGGDDGMFPAPRSEFPDTSAWLPVITTAENGKATVTIDLPDNTTSWRLSVKAITLNHAVGQAITNVETKKDVFIRPILPRILTNGDQATLTAFIHNYSAQNQTLTVQLSAPGLEIRSEVDQIVSLTPGQVLPVGWQVRVQSAKPTQVTFTAKHGVDVLDAILLPLNLQPAAIQDIQNQSGQFSGALNLALPLPNVERETSEVRLTLNRSMSGTLLNGLDYLTGYPYGCVEQTMSRALPNAVVAHASAELGIGGVQMQAHLEPMIKASIQRLYGLQHSDGGWGWWTDDVSDPYQTAWVLFGLGVIDDSGHPIEPKVMDEAAKFLDDHVGSYSQLDIRTQAYALYSMAQSERGNLEETRSLVSRSIHELDPFSQAALALALEKLGEKDEAQSVLDILSASALKNSDHVYWPQPNYDGEYHSKTMASSVRTTAFALLAYAKIDPENALVPGIVNYLAGQRQGIYGWGTTNETSFTILALTEHLVHQENELGTTPYEVLVNGKSLAFGTLQVGHASVGIDIPLAELKDGVNSVLVTTQSENPIYYDLSTRYDMLQKDLNTAGNIFVTRRYLDPKTMRPVENFETGQLVKVEVKIQVPEKTYFLAVEDHLPGGLEALNEGLSATSQVRMDMWGYEGYHPFYWEEYGYNYKEIRGDRVVFFITEFEKGSRTFTYYTRVTSSGQFLALPTQAYAMYDLSLWGRSESATLQIDE